MSNNQFTLRTCWKFVNEMFYYLLYEFLGYTLIVVVPFTQNFRKVSHFKWSQFLRHREIFTRKILLRNVLCNRITKNEWFCPLKCLKTLKNYNTVGKKDHISVQDFVINSMCTDCCCSRNHLASNRKSMKVSGGSRIFQTKEFGANLRGEVANLLFGKIFAENCMKMKEIGWGRVSVPVPWIRQYAHT